MREREEIHARTIIYQYNLLKETLKYLQSSFSFFQAQTNLIFSSTPSPLSLHVSQPSSIIPLHKNRKRKRKDVSDDRRKRMGIKVGNETPCLKNTTNQLKITGPFLDFCARVSRPFFLARQTEFSLDPISLCAINFFFFSSFRGTKYHAFLMCATEEKKFSLLRFAVCTQTVLLFINCQSTLSQI